MGFFLYGSHRKAYFCAESTKHKNTMQVDTNRSDADAREGILSLLSDLPDAVKSMFFTDDECVGLLKRGGVSSSLESSLIRRAFQHAPSEFKLQFQCRPQEKIPGLVCLRISLFLGFFLYGSHRKAYFCAESTKHKNTMQVDTNRSDADAREGILSLLSDLPDAVKSMFFTDDECVGLLKRGGVSSSLESSLIRRAFQHAPSEFKLQFQCRPQEKIPGLEGRHRSYRLCSAADHASPYSQRKSGRRGKFVLATIEQGFFQNKKHRSHLLAISTYYGESSRATDDTTESSSSSSSSSSSPSDDVHVPDGLRVVEIRREREMFQTLFSHHCGLGNTL